MIEPDWPSRMGTQLPETWLRQLPVFRIPIEVLRGICSLCGLKLIERALK
jgi:hypothetical protein